MATKKTTAKAAPKKTTPKAAPKAAKAPKATVSTKARHPRARVKDNHETKAALAKSLAAVIARSDEDTDALEGRLARASNAQLLRLSRVTATVKQKYGNREKLIAAIGSAQNKSKDKDFLANLDKHSLPQLLDLAAAAERRAKANA
jgi:hypothetical protein